MKVIDLETTGYDGVKDKIVQVGVVDEETGNVDMDIIIKPGIHIPNKVAAIHGITDDMVCDAPLWEDVRPDFIKLTQGQGIIIYNSAFDIKFLDHDITSRFTTVHCCMKMFAAYYGKKYGSYKWQKLAFAAEHFGFVWPPDAGPHSAAPDCQATRHVWRKLHGK